MVGYNESTLRRAGIAGIVIGGILMLGSIGAGVKSDKPRWIYPAGTLCGYTIMLSGAAVGAAGLRRRET